MKLVIVTGLSGSGKSIARHALEERGTPCGFLHLPPTEALACGCPPVRMDDQVRGVRRILTELSR